MTSPGERDPIGAARIEAEGTGVLPAGPGAVGEVAGDVIGRYELLEEIGQGGMGSVWMAQQKEPVVRRVALKVIKLGMDTHEVVVRFEAERQALALMDHPHIAKVFDGGATSKGRPYFVMELVAGTPITEYCDGAKLALRERLRLFTSVCDAVQHAHQKGIIHRDIKPGNVLVTLQDGEPVPKVIDFGIAKATGAELTEKTMHTELGQVLGTPEYMAPEQLGMSGLDIDTRADVYSLGVLLYELLTGSKPFDIQKIIAAGYDELLRTIREVDPEKPSTRITNLDDSATIAELRQLDVRAFGKQLSGDLDWVVMKALEKDRARRYETANGLAADVQRFLDQEPVVAAPPSATYRLRKFVKRRKKTVAAMATIAFSLIAGSIGTGVGLWRTIQAKAEVGAALAQKEAALKEEERQRTLAQENEARAKEAEGEAKARATELEQVAEFQSSQLSQLDPELMGVRMRRNLIDATSEDRRAALTAQLAGLNFTSLALGTLEENIFERTIQAIDKQFRDQPLVQARLLLTAGNTLRGLGLHDLAEDPTQRALSIRRAQLGNTHPATLDSVNSMGFLLHQQGKLSEAEPYYTEALDGRREVLGDDHPSTLQSIQNMGGLLRNRGSLDEAEVYYRTVLESRRRVLGDAQPQTLQAIRNLGGLLRAQGRFVEAEPYHREALAGYRRVLGDDDTRTLMSIGNMGFLLHRQGKLSEAEPYLREALEGHRRKHGEDHPLTLKSIGAMGNLLMDQGKLVEAEDFIREAYEGHRRVLGNGHTETLKSVNSLGNLLREQGKLDEAEVHLRECLAGNRQFLGDEHPETLSAMNNMGVLLQAQGKLSEAEPYFRQTLDSRRRIPGDDNPLTLTSMNNLGGLLQAQGRLSEAELLFRESIEGCRRVLGNDHATTLLSINGLGLTLHYLGELDDAERHLREAFEGLQGTLGERHSLTTIARTNLKLLTGDLVAAAGRTNDDQERARILARVGDDRLLLGDHAGAEAALREALDLFVGDPTTDAHFQRVLSDLGVAVAAQGRRDEAEAALAEAAEMALAMPDNGSAEEAIVEHLIDFYASQPSTTRDADEWRARLEERRNRAAK